MPSDLFATENDIRAAYRLLLNREPDPEGFRFFVERCRAGELTMERLHGSIIWSDEYQARRQRDPASALLRHSEIDQELLLRHRAPPELLTADPSCFTNWLGIRTDASLFPQADALRGKVFPEIPLSGDGVFGGYNEYFALLHSIEAVPDRRRLSMVELGAGWGPWISAAGVCCRRMGFKDIGLCGVEADASRFEKMHEHFTRNGLTDLNCRLIHGAAWSSDTTLKFPKIDVRDHGAAIGEGDGVVDYRGHARDVVDVPAYSVDTICGDLGVIDYMHWDLQGAEIQVAQSAINFLDERVRFIFVGTHSRLIEGELLELFFQHKWDLILEAPCRFAWDLGKPSLTGMIVMDGEVFLRNPKLL